MRRTNMRSDTNGWLTVKAIAAVTGYNPEYIRQLIRAGSVAARKVGARLFVNQESLVVYQSVFQFQIPVIKHDIHSHPPPLVASQKQRTR